MTRQHMAALCFEGKPEAAKKRVQKLMAAGLVAERKRQPNEPGILFLARRGFKVLDEAGRLASYPQRDWKSFQKRVQVSPATIRHELAVLDVKSAFATAMRDRPGLSLAEFSTWPKLYEFRARRPITRDGWTHEREVLMKPDGFIRIHERTPEGAAEHCFFLEVDHGTESLEVIAGKALGYRHYYHTGGFAKKLGGDPASPGDYPFRVLMVLRSPERLANIARVLLEQSPPIRTQVWLAVASDVSDAPDGPVWQQPADDRPSRSLV